MNKLSRVFFSLVLSGTCSLNGGASWGMDRVQSLSPEDLVSHLINTLPEETHIGEYVESLKPENPFYNLFYSSFVRDLNQVDKLVLKEWTEMPVFQNIAVLGVRSPFLLPGLMQALKENTTLRIIDSSGVPLTAMDEKCIAEISEVNKRIIFKRDSHNSDPLQILNPSPERRPTGEEGIKITVSKSEPDRSGQLGSFEDRYKALYLHFKKVFNTMDSLVLSNWMETSLMVDAKCYGLTSPFMLPGFIEALKENTTIKTFDVRGYKVTTADDGYINGVFAANKGIRVIKDSESVTVAPKRLDKGKNEKGMDKGKNPVESPKNRDDQKPQKRGRVHQRMASMSLTETLAPDAEASLMDLEKSYEMGKIDTATYEMLKEEFISDLKKPSQIEVKHQDKEDFFNAELSSYSLPISVKGKGAITVEDFLIELKRDYEAQKIDLPTYTYWRNRVAQDVLMNFPEDEILDNTLLNDLASSILKPSDVDRMMAEGILNLQRTCERENLKALSFKGKKLSKDYVGILCEFLKIDMRLTHLDLSNCQLDDIDIVKLVLALTENKTLLNLDLSQNKIGAMGAGAFHTLFGSICYCERKRCFNDTLQIVDLDGNDISKELMRKVEVGIKFSKSTRSFDLIGDMLKASLNAKGISEKECFNLKL